MNRDLEKLLKEKWFLLVADLIVVIAILCAMPEKRDGGTTFIIVVAILLASLIVVIPVLTDGGSKAERLAEQARLRTALAAEIDQLRDGLRAGTEAVNRRMMEVETTAQKAAEANAAAVAQRASTEINALKAALAELEKKLTEVAAAAQAAEAVDELTTKVGELASTVRSLVAEGDEAAEAANKAQAEAAQALELEIKSVRDDLKKSAKVADKQAERNEAAIESLRADIKDLSASPPRGAAPRPPPSMDGEPKVASAVQGELLSAPAEEAEEEVGEEISEDEPAPAVVESASASTGGAGTSLIVNLMIGIGNKPFVRGTGPGLSKDKGVPMNFVSIGLWQWICPDPDAPATVEIWKNDQTPMGEPLHLSGGELVQLDESHFGGS